MTLRINFHPRTLGGPSRGSGSLLLQDYRTPHIHPCERPCGISRLSGWATCLNQADRRSEEASRITRSVPVREHQYDIHCGYRTLGTQLQACTVVITEPDIDKMSIQLLTALGGRRRGRISTTRASGHAPPAITLNCSIEWSNSLNQQFSKTFKLAAEDQKLKLMDSERRESVQPRYHFRRSTLGRKG